MTDKDESKRTIDTGGGAHVDGPLATGGGDAVDLRGSQAPVVGATGPVDVQFGDRYYQTPPYEPRTPLQRPARATHWVGRETELAWLLAELQPGRVVTLCGPGGIGKSALAAEAIWALAPDGAPPERFPDGIVTHSFYRQPQAAVAMEAICRAYGEEPRPTPRAAAQRALAGRRALLYLDGTEDADDLPSVLDVRGGCGVLVTSRQRRDAASHADRHDLAPLPPDEAVRLLRLWGGERASEEETAARACDLVGRLPLAVRLVGRYLVEADEDLAAYVAWLEETPLPALDWGERRQESVPVLLGRSVAQVSEQARQALAVVGLLARASFGREAIAAGVGSTEAQVRRPLAELVDYGLLLREGGYYRVSHALVHAYARGRCSPPAGAAERLAAHYTALAKAQTTLEAEGYRRLEGERAQLARVVEASAARQDWQGVLDLVSTIRQYLSYQGHWTDLSAAIRHGLHASRALGNLQEEADCIRWLGDVHLGLAEYPEARQRYEKARTVFAQIGDRRGEAKCIQSLGHVHLRLAELEEAKQRYEEARTIFAQIGDRRGEAKCIRALGDVHLRLDELEETRQRYEQARTVFAQIGDRLGEVTCIQSLGDMHYMRGELEEARQCYEEAQLIFAQIGDRLGEADAIGSLGDVYRQLDRLDEAHQRYEEAHTIFVQIGDRLGEANCIRALGHLHRMRDEYLEARQHYEEVRPIYAQIGDRYSYAATLAYLGLVDRGLGEIERAQQCLREAVVILKEIGSPQASLIQQWLDQTETPPEASEE
jgi:tetratricopeptide (TPR) repeat protein